MSIKVYDRLKSVGNDLAQNNYGSIPLESVKPKPITRSDDPSYSDLKVPLHKLLHDPTLSHIIGRRASPWSIGFSIVKSAVGVGILNLPWATANIGLLPTLFLLFISMIFSFICWIFLVKAAERLRVFEFRDIGLKIYGQNFALFTDFVLIVFSIMCCVLFLVYIGDFISNGLSEYGIFINEQIITEIHITSFTSFIATKCFILTVTMFAVLFPLTLLTRLDNLKFTSIVGMVATAITVAYISYNFFVTPVIHKSVQWANTYNGSSMVLWFWLESFGVFSAAFFAHFNTAPLYGELVNRSVASMAKVTAISFALILILNLFMIVTAYFTFGEDVQQNVIESLDNGSNTSIVALLRILMSFNMIGSYPLLFWNVKISMKNLVFYRADGSAATLFRSNAAQRVVYFVINACVWCISLFVNDVAQILALVQASCGMLVLFVFPVIFYMTISKKDRVLTRNMRLLCVVILVFGFIAMVGGLCSTIMNMVGFI